MAHKTRLKLPPPDRTGKPEAHMVRLGARGRVVLPAPVRRKMGLSAGDKLLFLVEPDGRIVLTTVEARVRKLQGSLKHLVEKGGSLVEDLIRERRAEAARE